MGDRPGGAVRDRIEHGAARVVGALGGRSRATIVVLLAAMLALNSADGGAVGAVAPSLKRVFSLSNGGIGVISAVVSIASALATVPAGVLADRVCRTRLLAVSVAVWTLAMAVSGASVSYTMLLSSRVFLGVVTATAGPTAASLVGDMFRPAERGRILGWIDVGDLIGVGAGFLLVGAVIALLSWRWVFFLLAVAGAALVVPLWRRPEPRRRSADGHRNDDIRHDELAELIRRADIEPDTHVDVPHGREASLVEVVRYVLQVKTNAIVILASAIGYFFLAGLRIFAVVFAIEQYRISHAAASFLIPVVGVGAVAGMIAGGHVGDFLLHRGHLTARLLVGAAGFLITAAVTVPAVLTHSVAVALPLLTVGAFGLAAPNPPMDAVRLDIVHPAVWGRAEGVRTMLRTGAEALAPLLFGFLADHLAGGGHRGLQVTIIVMLPALVANAVLLLVARRFYLRDIATVHSTLDPGRR